MFPASASILPSLLILLLAGTPVAAGSASGEKTICKTFAETGSFAKKRRICMTRAQWQQVYDQTRGELREASERALINSRQPDGKGG